MLLWVNSNQESSSSFGGKIAASTQLVSRVKWNILMVLIGYGTSIQLVSRVKWNILMVLIGYGSNDDSVICMTLIQKEKQNIFLIFQEVEWYSFWFWLVCINCPVHHPVSRLVKIVIQIRKHCLFKDSQVVSVLCWANGCSCWIFSSF